MGRQKLPAAEAVDVPINQAAVAADSQALTVIGQRQSEIQQAYGEGLPYDRNRIVSEARFYMGQSAEALLEAGRRLILLKEHETHGEFTSTVEQQLGIPLRAAQKMMQAAAKYLAPAIAAKAPSTALLGLGRTKLLELISEPDEAIAELAEGGTLAGKTLDEIEAMSARELRDTLRKDRERRTKDIAAKDKVLAKKEAKITELEEQLARRQAVDGAEAEQAQLDVVRDAALQVEMALRALGQEAGAVVAEPVTEAAGVAARNAVGFIAQLLADLIHQHGFNVDFEEAVKPHWLAGTARG